MFLRFPLIPKPQNTQNVALDILASSPSIKMKESIELAFTTSQAVILRSTHLLDLPRTKSWDISLDCHTGKYRGGVG